MEKEFVPYELAVKLKALGFSNPYSIGGYQGGAVFYYEEGKLYYDGRPMYSSDSHEGQIIAPLYQQAFRWFREKNYYIAINIYPTTLISSEFFTIEIEYINEKGMIEWFDDFTSNTQFDTYEEAALACLIKLIEIVETRTK